MNIHLFIIIKFTEEWLTYMKNSFENKEASCLGNGFIGSSQLKLKAVTDYCCQSCSEKL